MAKKFFFLLCVSVVFLGSVSLYAALDEWSCMTFDEFKSLPAEISAESVRVEMPESKGYFQHVASRLKKYVNGYSVTFLVFDGNGEQVPLFMKITRGDISSSFIIFGEQGECVQAYSNDAEVQFSYRSTEEENTLRLVGIRFFFRSAKRDGTAGALISRNFYLRKSIPITIKRGGME